jgi:hypothetical protein
MKPRVISIDGFAWLNWPDPAARLPVLRGLAERGVLAAGMETVFPSTTWPTHASLVTGVSPSAHRLAADREALGAHLPWTGARDGQAAVTCPFDRSSAAGAGRPGLSPRLRPLPPRAASP